MEEERADEFPRAYGAGEVEERDSIVRLVGMGVLTEEKETDVEHFGCDGFNGFIVSHSQETLEHRASQVKRRGALVVFTVNGCP